MQVVNEVMKLIVILKKNLQKASLVLHAFVSTKGMYINLIPVRDKVGRGGVLYKRTMGEIIVILRT